MKNNYSTHSTAKQEDNYLSNYSKSRKLFGIRNRVSDGSGLPFCFYQEKQGETKRLQRT